MLQIYSYTPGSVKVWLPIVQGPEQEGRENNSGPEVTSTSWNPPSFIHSTVSPTSTVNVLGV